MAAHIRFIETGHEEGYFGSTEKEVTGTKSHISCIRYPLNCAPKVGHNLKVYDYARLVHAMRLWTRENPLVTLKGTRKWAEIPLWQATARREDGPSRVEPTRALDLLEPDIIYSGDGVFKI